MLKELKVQRLYADENNNQVTVTKMIFPQMKKIVGSVDDNNSALPFLGIFFS